MTCMPDDSGSSKYSKKPKFMERFFSKKSDTEMVQEKEEEILSLVEEGQEKGLIEDIARKITDEFYA